MRKKIIPLLGCCAGLLAASNLMAAEPVLEAQYKKISSQEIPGNIIKMVGDDWMLITAGDGKEKGQYNTMTASWGGLGSMWGFQVSFIMVRNQRYTYQFLEKSKYYTLTFYDNKYRPQLQKIFGTKSGRDSDKVKESGFHPIDTGYGMAYSEANLIICCRKIYGDKMAEENAIPELSKEWYFNGSKDYHKIYFGEIVAVWLKK